MPLMSMCTERLLKRLEENCGKEINISRLILISQKIKIT